MITVGLAAGFALAANAFMIPSTMSLKPEGFAKSMEQLTQPSTRLVKLDCPDCSVPDTGAHIEGDNALVMNFALSEDRKALLLNGGVIYPGLPIPFIPVTQTASDTSFEALQDTPTDVVSGERLLSFASTMNQIVAADGTDAELVDLNFHITSIGQEPVNIDGLDIRLLKAEDGTLGIGDIVQVASAEHPAIETGEELFEIKPIDNIVPIEAKPAGCSQGMPDVLCHFRAMMVDRLESLRHKAQNSPLLFGKHRKPCPGMMRKLGLKGGVDKFKGQHQEEKPHQGPPHGGPHGHHRHHHMHHRVHRIMMGARRILFGFVIPVMIGVAAGMTASLVGMVVGTAIAYLWIHFVRKGRRGSASRRVRLETETEASAMIVNNEHVPEEKRGLMTDVEEGAEAPPQYVEKE